MCGKGVARLTRYTCKLRVAQIPPSLFLEAKRIKYVERPTFPVDEKYSEDLIYSLDEKQKIAKEGVSLFASSASFH